LQQNILLVKRYASAKNGQVLRNLLKERDSFMPHLIDSNILGFLKTHGPTLDAEIAHALKVPLTRVKSHIAALSSAGDVICCNTIQFKDGGKIEGISCRLSCYSPPAARGRKPGVKKASATDLLSEN
jgi:hypothetical protein